MKIPKIGVYTIYIEPTPNNLVNAQSFINELKDNQLCLIVSKIATKAFFNADIVTYDLPTYIKEIKRISRKFFPDGFRIDKIDSMSFNEKDNKTDEVGLFEVACYELAEKVNNQLFNGERNWRWVNGVIGDVCDFEDADFININEMAIIVAKKISYETYAEWRDANESNKGIINLSSWLRGCRHSMLKIKKETR